MIRRFVAFTILSLLCVSTFLGEALAQDAQSLSGNWTITVIDNPDASFSGSAQVRYDVNREIATATLVTEDTCCQGLNHAVVKQKSVIRMTGSRISVTSKIVEFLVEKAERPSVTYSADNFELEWINKDILVGTANGFTQVQWTRSQENVS